MQHFDTSNRSFRQLVGNGLTYRVPRFQRSDSWTETEWDDLWHGQGCHLDLAIRFLISPP